MSDILYGIKKVVLTELDPTTGLVKASNPIICEVETAEQAELTPVISNGDEKVLRTESEILAIARTEDLLYGYNLKLKDNTFDVNVASLIEGGTVRRDGGNNIVGYDSPKLADGATMKPFQAEIYVANYEGDSIVNYTKVTLNNCKGKAPKLDFKKDFFAPEFEIKARENTKANKPIKSVDYVDTLPSEDTTAPTLTRTGNGSITIPAAYVGHLDSLGTIYVVPAGATISKQADLQALCAVGMGKYGTMLSALTDVSIATTGLTAGSYKVYGVDTAGNVTAGQSVTLE